MTHRAPATCGSGRRRTTGSPPSPARTCSRRRTGAWRRWWRCPPPRSRGLRRRHPGAVPARRRHVRRVAGVRVGRNAGTADHPPGAGAVLGGHPGNLVTRWNPLRLRQLRDGPRRRPTGSPPRPLAEGGSPQWIDDRSLLVTIDHKGRSRLAAVDLADPWPRPLTLGDGYAEAALLSADGRIAAYAFYPADDRRRGDIRVVDLSTGEDRRLWGRPGSPTNPRPSAPTAPRSPSCPRGRDGTRCT